ncbi:hypothetical protein ACHAXR_007913 [Thalassiosira sp. AJA248-18]
MRYAIGLCGSFISASRTSFLPSTQSSSSTPFLGRLCRGSLILPLSTSSSSSSSFSHANMVLWMQLTTRLEEKIKLEDERYQNASKRSWELNAALVRVEMSHETSEDSLPKEEESLDKLVRETILSPEMYDNFVHESSPGGDQGENNIHQRARRLAGLSNKLEDYARYKAFHHFLAEEKLLSPSAPCFVVTENGTQRNILTDEEYLGGACIGLCHDLSKYGVTRASNAVHDAAAVPFIKRARDAVSLILEELLEFDFRNGPLRRKYDSTKYALKTLETCVAGAVGGHEGLVGNENNNVDGGGPVKRIKIAKEDEKGNEDVTMQEGDEESSPIPKKEIGALRERMDHRDKLRESLIKTCRDGQKGAKQAIFAMHRGDAKRASKLLDDCEKCVKNDLIPILEEEPTLRYGSFSGVLEEYVEGKLFYTWLHGDEGNAKNGSNEQAVGKILLPDEIPLNISTEDYLGGLCDLTGEIGRFAVARGTARDKESVKLCLDSNKSIYMTLKILGKLPKNISKKMGMVSKSVEKLERVLYEQSLMEMTGRKECRGGPRPWK